jgi:hypothetical protein
MCVMSRWMEHLLLQTGCSYLDRSGHSSWIGHTHTHIHTYIQTHQVTAKADHFIEMICQKLINISFNCHATEKNNVLTKIGKPSIHVVDWHSRKQPIANSACSAAGRKKILFVLEKNTFVRLFYSTIFTQIHHEWICVMLSTDVCLSICNEIYCDETANATNMPFSANIPLDNINRSAIKRRRKSPPFWLPAAILNFWGPAYDNAITFEPFDTSTPDRRHFAQDQSLLNSGCIWVLQYLIFPFLWW